MRQDNVTAMLRSSEYLAGHALGRMLGSSHPEQARAIVREILKADGASELEATHRLRAGLMCGVVSAGGMAST